jgi:hypothetical protein
MSGDVPVLGGFFIMADSTEKMFSDLQLMQLFAEQVLAYRLLKTKSQFHSFGFHEPNTDERRQVYTLVDPDAIYYFLGSVTGDSISRALTNVQQMIQNSPMQRIQQVVLVGESTISNERDRIQELVDHFQFIDGLDELSNAVPSGMQITLLPDIETCLRPIQKRLTYINEDPYWDPSRDHLERVGNHLLPSNRATEILNWMEHHPPMLDGAQAGGLQVGDRLPDYANSNGHSPTTALQNDTAVQPDHTRTQPNPAGFQPMVAGVPMNRRPIEPVGVTAPRQVVERRTNLERRSGNDRRLVSMAQEKWSGLNDLTRNLLLFLGSLGLLSLLAWLIQSTVQNLTDPNYRNRYGAETTPLTPANPNPPPPPAGAIVQPATPQATTPQATTPQATTPQAIASVPQVVQQPQVVQLPAVQPTVPVAAWTVQAPSPHDGVNFRVAPGMGASIMRGIPNGYRLIDEGRQVGEWREVSFQGQRGWVYRRFIR